jgi:hypothetical protein
VKRLAALVVAVAVLAPWPTSASTPEPGTILRVRVRTPAEAVAATQAAETLLAQGDYVTALAFLTGVKKWTEATVTALANP